MKKLVFFSMLLFACILSYGQLFQTTNVTLNVMSYPTMPLEHQNFNLKIEGLGAVSEYGVTYEGIEKLFSQTVKMVYTKENNYDYTLKISFETPSFKNDGIQQNSFGGQVSFYGVATCNIPVYTTLINKDGFEITEKHLVCAPFKITGEKCSTQPDASKKWNDYIKNSNKVLADNINEALKTALWDFQSKHDVFSYPKKIEFHWARATKKFKEERWAKNVETLKNIQLQMIPGQSLVDFKDTIVEMIKFYEDQYNWAVKNKGKSLIKSGAAINASYLCMLLPDFERMEKCQELLAEWKILNYISRDQDSYAKEYNERYNKYMKGPVDAECIELSKLNHLKDSLATKPSNVKIYLTNNTIVETQAFINVYRPGTVINNGNIIDLSFGQILELCENNTTKVYKRLISKDVVKVVAGDELYYPVMFGGNNNPRFSFLLFESPKIRILQFKSDLLLQKTGDENAEIFNPSLFGSLNKKLSKYFADCPEIVQELSKKEVKIESQKDVINIAKKYSELK